VHQQKQDHSARCKAVNTSDFQNNTNQQAQQYTNARLH
jgi:hypothetical protein